VILVAALITIALLAGGITALISTHHGGQTAASGHHSGETLLPPGKYIVDREISTQDQVLASLANVQISDNGMATFNIAETNEGSGSALLRCGSSPAPPSEWTVRLSNGQVDKAVADTCSDNPAWQVTNWQPGQTIVYYATFRNNPGFTQPFTFGIPGGATVSGIRLSQGVS
jgi:hypothetical protein